MALTAKTKDGRVLYAAVHRMEDAPYCRDCDERLSWHRASIDGRRAHYAHLPQAVGSAPRSCASEMSPEHDEARWTLLAEAPNVFDSLAGAVGKPEQDVDIPSDPPRRRRADVLFFGDDKVGRYPVAFEAQFSHIVFPADGSGRTIEERTADYHAAGIHVVWCFLERRTTREHIDACRRRYGCVGVLSQDGASVEFQGVNTLWLDSDPIEAGQRRAAFLAEQERRRQQRAQEEAAAYAQRIAEMEAERREREALQRRIADRSEHERMERERRHIAALDARMTELRAQPAPVLDEDTRALRAAQSISPRLPVSIKDCARAYDWLGHVGLSSLLIKHRVIWQYGDVLAALERWFPEVLPTADRPYAAVYYEAAAEADKKGAA